MSTRLRLGREEVQHGSELGNHDVGVAAARHFDVNHLRSGLLRRFHHDMEEVASSNLTRSTKTFQTLTVPQPAKPAITESKSCQRR
jgi:hypothetical protein